MRRFDASLRWGERTLAFGRRMNASICRTRAFGERMNAFGQGISTGL